MDNYEFDYEYEIDTDAIIAKKSFVVEKDKMSARFLTGLKQYNLTYEEIVNSNWRYVGGDGGEVARNLFMNGTYHKIKKEDSKYNRCHLNYWILCFPNEELPDLTDRCVCDHIIIENCYIANEDDSEFLVLGNCCIERFIPLKGRTCKLCKASHKNRKVNLCNECRLFCTDCKTTINTKKDVKCEKCVDKDNEFQCGNCEKILDSRITKHKYCSKCDDILFKKKCGVCKITTFDIRYESSEYSDTCLSCIVKIKNQLLQKIKNQLCGICNIYKFDGRYATNCDICEKLKYIKICGICNVNTFNSSIWNNCAKCSVQKLIIKHPIKIDETPVEPVANKCQKCDAILKNPTYKFCFKCFGNCIICQKKVDPRFKKCFDCNKNNK